MLRYSWVSCMYWKSSVGSVPARPWPGQRFSSVPVKVPSQIEGVCPQMVFDAQSGGVGGDGGAGGFGDGDGYGVGWPTARPRLAAQLAQRAAPGN